MVVRVMLPAVKLAVEEAVEVIASRTSAPLSLRERVSVMRLDLAERGKPPRLASMVITVAHQPFQRTLSLRTAGLAGERSITAGRVVLVGLLRVATRTQRERLARIARVATAGLVVMEPMAGRVGRLVLRMCQTADPEPRREAGAVAVVETGEVGPGRMAGLCLPIRRLVVRLPFRFSITTSVVDTMRIK